MPAGQVVRLDFYTFDTYGYLSYGSVSGDYVRVYDGCTADNDKIIDTYYGPEPAITDPSNYEHNLPSSILSTGNVLHITFTSDGGVTRQGFSATASGVDLAGNMTLEYYLLKVKHVNSLMKIKPISLFSGPATSTLPAKTSDTKNYRGRFTI